MITLDALKEFGADTEKGLALCMGNEAMYLRLVSSVPSEKRFDDLSNALSEGNLDEAFDAAHALKGVLGNLSLTPLYEKASEITELLRAKADVDYGKLMGDLTEGKDRLKNLCE